MGWLKRVMRELPGVIKMFINLIGMGCYAGIHINMNSLDSRTKMRILLHVTYTAFNKVDSQ